MLFNLYLNSDYDLYFVQVGRMMVITTKFVPSGGWHLRNVNYLVLGIFVLMIGAIFFYLLPPLIEELFPKEMLDIVPYLLLLPFIIGGAVMIYMAFLWTTKEYFLYKNGKCGILKNSYCQNGDCRDCVFADTYVKNEMYDENKKE